MEDQLISLETAVLATEKGFDVPCRNWWVETVEHELHIPRSGVELFPAHSPRILSHKPVEDYHIIHAPAPTQTSLQKFLMKRHGIKVIVDTDETLSWIFTIQSLCPEASYVGDYIHSMYCFSSFEEALEAGLFQALKLIK